MGYDTQIGVRLPTEIVERLDAFAVALQSTTGIRVTRNEAVRVLLARALEAAPETKRRKK